VTERQQLLGILGLIYLSECIRWVRRGGVVFNRAPDLRVWRKSPFLNNPRGDIHVGWPLPPFGEFVVARGLPFSLDSDGLVTATTANLHPDGPAPQPILPLTWEECGRITVDGEQLLRDHKVFWLADTAAEAARLGSLLRTAAALPASQRDAWLETTAKDQFDVPTIRSRWESSQAAVKPLRLVGSALWTLMFLLLPLAVWQWGWTPPLWIGIPALFLGSFWIARRLHQLHAQWFPEARDDRFRLVLLAALSPVTAIRSAEVLMRPRFEEFHPAAVAMALLPRDRADAFCAQLWRELRHPRLPLPVSTEVGNRRLGRWHDRLLGALREAAIANGSNPDRWEAPPGKTDSAHARFCPRCHSQSTAAASLCSECGGIPLLDLPSGPTNSAASSAVAASASLPDPSRPSASSPPSP
jgi:hypothetical protein